MKEITSSDSILNKTLENQDITLTKGQELDLTTQEPQVDPAVDNKPNLQSLPTKPTTPIVDTKEAVIDTKQTIIENKPATISYIANELNNVKGSSIADQRKRQALYDMFKTAVGTKPTVSNDIAFGTDEDLSITELITGDYLKATEPSEAESMLELFESSDTAKQQRLMMGDETESPWYLIGNKWSRDYDNAEDATEAFHKKLKYDVYLDDTRNIKKTMSEQALEVLSDYETFGKIETERVLMLDKQNQQKLLTYMKLMSPTSERGFLLEWINSLLTTTSTSASKGLDWFADRGHDMLLGTVGRVMYSTEELSHIQQVAIDRRRITETMYESQKPIYSEGTFIGDGITEVINILPYMVSMAFPVTAGIATASVARDLEQTMINDWEMDTGSAILFSTGISILLTGLEKAQGEGLIKPFTKEGKEKIVTKTMERVISKNAKLQKFFVKVDTVANLGKKMSKDTLVQVGEEVVQSLPEEFARQMMDEDGADKGGLGFYKTVMATATESFRAMALLSAPGAIATNIKNKKSLLQLDMESQVEEKVTSKVLQEDKRVFAEQDGRVQKVVDLEDSEIEDYLIDAIDDADITVEEKDELINELANMSAEEMARAYRDIANQTMAKEADIEGDVISEVVEPKQEVNETIIEEIASPQEKRVVWQWFDENSKGAFGRLKKRGSKPISGNLYSNPIMAILALEVDLVKNLGDVAIILASEIGKKSITSVEHFREIFSSVDKETQDKILLEARRIVTKGEKVVDYVAVGDTVSRFMNKTIRQERLGQQKVERKTTALKNKSKKQISSLRERIKMDKVVSKGSVEIVIDTILSEFKGTKVDIRDVIKLIKGVSSATTINGKHKKLTEAVSILKEKRKSLEIAEKERTLRTVLTQSKRKFEAKKEFAEENKEAYDTIIETQEMLEEDRKTRKLLKELARKEKKLTNKKLSKEDRVVLEEEVKQLREQTDNALFFETAEDIQDAIYSLRHIKRTGEKLQENARVKRLTTKYKDKINEIRKEFKEEKVVTDSLVSELSNLIMQRFKGVKIDAKRITKLFKGITGAKTSKTQSKRFETALKEVYKLEQTQRIVDAKVELKKKLTLLEKALEGKALDVEHNKVIKEATKEYRDKLAQDKEIKESAGHIKKYTKELKNENLSSEERSELEGKLARATEMNNTSLNFKTEQDVKDAIEDLKAVQKEGKRLRELKEEERAEEIDKLAEGLDVEDVKRMASGVRQKTNFLTEVPLLTNLKPAMMLGRYSMEWIYDKLRRADKLRKEYKRELLKNFHKTFESLFVLDKNGIPTSKLKDEYKKLTYGKSKLGSKFDIELSEAVGIYAYSLDEDGRRNLNSTKLTKEQVKELKKRGWSRKDINKLKNINFNGEKLTKEQVKELKKRGWSMKDINKLKNINLNSTKLTKEQVKELKNINFNGVKNAKSLKKMMTKLKDTGFSNQEIVDMKNTGYTDADIDAIVSKLKEDIPNIEKMMNEFFEQFNQVYEDMAKVYKELTGMELKKVKNYFMLDNVELKENKEVEVDGVLGSIKEGAGFKTTNVKDKQTKERTGSANRFQSIDFFMTANKQIEMASSYINMRADAEFINAFLAHEQTIEYLDAFTPKAKKVIKDLLRNVYNDKITVDDKIFSKIVNYMRGASTIDILGGNMSTVLKQASSITNSAVAITSQFGGSTTVVTARIIKNIITNLTAGQTITIDGKEMKVKEYYAELSERMDGTAGSFEMYELIEGLGNKKKITELLARNGYNGEALAHKTAQAMDIAKQLAKVSVKMISVVDEVVATGVAVVAREIAIENGLSQADVDTSVVEVSLSSQPSHDMLSMSANQRAENAWVRSFTMFASMPTNILSQNYKAYRDRGLAGLVHDLAFTLAIPTLAMSILGSLTLPDDEEDIEDLAMMAGGTLASGFTFGGNLFQFANWNGSERSIMPALLSNSLTRGQEVIVKEQYEEKLYSGLYLLGGVAGLPMNFVKKLEDTAKEKNIFSLLLSPSKAKEAEAFWNNED